MSFKKYTLTQPESFPIMDQLEVGYMVNLLDRLTGSIETYLDDDRWDGIEVMYDEIKESKKLIRAYLKRVQKMDQDIAHESVQNKAAKERRLAIEKGLV